MIGIPDIILLIVLISQISSQDLLSEVEILKRALDEYSSWSFYSNSSEIIRILCPKTNSERQEIWKVYNSKYSEDLIKSLENKLSGAFRTFMVALMLKPADYDAKQLFEAMKGAGTTEEILIEILVTRNNQEIQEIKKVFQNTYNSSLEDAIIGETSGSVQNIFLAMLNIQRDPLNYTNPEEARKLAETLKRSMGIIFPDYDEIYKILLGQNFGQLRLVLDEYEKLNIIHPLTVEKDFHMNFHGYHYKTLKALLRFIRNPAGYFTDIFYKGSGMISTDKDLLIRTIVSRAEVDLPEIVREFKGKYRFLGFFREQFMGELEDAMIAFVESKL
ncbi:unnamed protein product [Caenorhabditis angaria]|uniref:Annexin n=1 Tax=Caenorhabditis angaria TaxID=860376 RepID=A0A9P1IMG0_9PELO|nr:unnamed protein product [Caenorhabditis angaria]